MAKSETKVSKFTRSLSDAVLKYPSKDGLLTSLSRKTEVSVELDQLRKSHFADQKVSKHKTADGVESMVVYLGVVTMAIYSTGTVSVASRKLNVAFLAWFLEQFAAIVKQEGYDRTYAKQLLAEQEYHLTMLYPASLKTYF